DVRPRVDFHQPRLQEIEGALARRRLRGFPDLPPAVGIRGPPERRAWTLVDGAEALRAFHGCFSPFRLGRNAVSAARTTPPKLVRCATAASFAASQRATSRTTVVFTTRRAFLRVGTGALYGITA